MLVSILEKTRLCILHPRARVTQGNILQHRVNNKADFIIYDKLMMHFSDRSSLDPIYDRSRGGAKFIHNSSAKKKN